MEDVDPGAGIARAENLQVVLRQFWNKGQQVLEDKLRNPTIFYHSYPNVDVKVASFQTPAKAVPSLLHHRLDLKLTETSSLLEGLQAAESNHCIFLIGAKGSGKTRTLYEILAENFGFYFVASKVENGESKDFVGIVETLKLGYPVYDRANTIIPRRVGLDAALCALLARFLIFSKCLEIKPDLSALEWLVCQTECRPRDLFCELTLLLIKQDLPSTLLEEQISALSQEVFPKIKGTLPCGKLLFVVDEALPHLKCRFRSDKQSDKLRSLLSQALKIFRMQSVVPTASIVAGVGSDLLAEAQELEPPDSSEGDTSAAEVICTGESYEHPGSFGPFYEYVASFLGPGDYKKMFDKYYQARAGTIATALHHYINKRVPREDALSFLQEFAHTLATRGGAHLGIPHSMHDCLASTGDRFFHCLLREIAEAFYLGGKGYILRHNSSIRLVEMGVATLKLEPYRIDPQDIATRDAPLSKHQMAWHYPVCALVNERFVQVALCHSFAVKVREEVFARFAALQAETEVMAHFEKYCPIYVLSLFSRDESLETMFGPEVRTGKVERRDTNRGGGKRRSPGRKGTDNNARGMEGVRTEAEEEAISHIEYGTGDIKDEVVALTKERIKLSPPPAGTPLMARLGHNWSVERWLNEGSERPTFLRTKTDNQFGPDFLAILEMPRIQRKLLLSIQVRPGMDPQRMDPQLFYSHNRQREVPERNQENFNMLKRHWTSGWVELLIAPCARLERENRPFPADKPCIRTSIDSTNLFRAFPKLLQYLRR